MGHIWFLTGSQSLYGPETLAEVARQSQAVVARLNASGEIPVDIVWQPVVTEADAIRRLVLAANSDDECVGLICWMHTFSPAKLWIAGLKQLAKPLLHLHTQAGRELPFATLDQDFMNLNQSAHGDREFGYILTRLGVARKIVVGHTSDPAVGHKIGMWARACLGAADVARLKICSVGANMREVADTDGDKVGLQITFGAEVDAYGITEVVDYVNAVDPAVIDALVAEYADRYDIVPELRPGGERHAMLRDGAAQEAGIRAFLDDHGARAWTNSFQDLGALRQLPGFAAQRLMAQGYGYGPEGDWKTPLLVRAAAVMGEGLPGGASLMEDYTYNLVPGREGVLGSHMLEIAETLTTTRPRLEIHPLGLVPKDDPVRLVFDADPAAAVIVGIVDLGGRFRMVANVVDVVAPEAPMRCLPSARAYWKPRPGFYPALEDWLALGGGHHDAITTQFGAEVWVDFARIFGVELRVIE
ncbi:MAG: L-arabinose isomerase [Propionibacteriaceae bacterium]|jgi:L-arabinose isomerase|nr:L-arabinose isomerase [Propionibacteriaceae bacterium]